MKHTTNILKAISADERVIQLYQDTINIPHVEDAYRPFNDKWYDHPPMLLPVFIDYSFPILKGFTLHPFSKRESSFVTYDLEVNYMLEKARTADQLISMMLLEMDMIEEGISEEMRAFAQMMDFTQVDEIDAFAEEFGDDPKHFGKLPFWDHKQPLTYLSPAVAYDGEFISSYKQLRTEAIADACSFEIVDKYKVLPEVQNVPWLSNTSNGVELFEKFMRDGNHYHAWLSLNRSDWIKEARVSALKKLEVEADNSLLSLIVENWVHGAFTSR